MGALKRAFLGVASFARELSGPSVAAALVFTPPAVSADDAGISVSGKLEGIVNEKVEKVLRRYPSRRIRFDEFLASVQSDLP